MQKSSATNQFNPNHIQIYIFNRYTSSNTPAELSGLIAKLDVGLIRDRNEFVNPSTGKESNFLL